MYYFVKVESETEVKKVFDIIVKGRGYIDIVKEGAFNFERNFINLCRGYFNEFFAIKDELKNEIIGVIFCYDLKALDRHCKMECIIDSSLINALDIEREEIKVYIEKMFKEYSLNRIFVEIIEKDRRCVYEEIGFSVEAELREYKYFKGTYHNLYVMAIDRQSYFK